MNDIVPDKEYHPFEFLGVLQKQLSEGFIVYESGNLFFKVILDLSKEFPKVWSYKKPEEEEINGINYIHIEGYTHKYDSMYILSTPETRLYFLNGWMQSKDE